MRTCTTCSHPQRKSIDARIVDKEPYRNIAKRFGINHVSLTRHGRNHVQPFINDIEQQANAAVLVRVMAYRDEVNLPLPEKSKHIENKLWADYDAIDDPVQRMAIVREINKQQKEQAMLAGDYTSPKENPTTAAVFAKWVDEVRHLATPGLSAIEFIAQCDAIGKGYPVLVERVKDGSIEIAGVQ